MWRTAALALLLALLVFATAARAGDSWSLSYFKQCRRYTLEGIDQNASGVTYMPESGTLWVVRNNPPGLFEYTLDGKLLRRLDVRWMHDPEDLVYLSRDRIAVLEEPPWGGIRVLDVSQTGGGKQLEYTPVRNPRSIGSGDEGLAYNPGTATYYVAQEEYPKRILAVPRDGRDRPGGSPGSGWSQVLDGDVACHTVGDIAAISYVPHLDQLFVLSQESKRVLRLTMDGRELQYLDVQLSYPEGMTFLPDGRTLIIVGEPNEMAVYRLDSC